MPTVLRSRPAISGSVSGSRHPHSVSASTIRSRKAFAYIPGCESATQGGRWRRRKPAHRALVVPRAERRGRRSCPYWGAPAPWPRSLPNGSYCYDVSPGARAGIEVMSLRVPCAPLVSATTSMRRATALEQAGFAVDLPGTSGLQVGIVLGGASAKPLNGSSLTLLPRQSHELVQKDAWWCPSASRPK